MMLGQRADLDTVEAIRNELGLDRPLVIRYARYINDLSPLSFHKSDTNHYFYFDREKYGKALTVFETGGGWIITIKPPFLGTSFQNRQPVGAMIWDVFPNTLILAVSAIILASVIGILLGILCAFWKDSWFDRLSIFFSTLGMSLPSFFAAILIGWLFAYVLGDLTGLNLTGNLREVDPMGDGYRIRLMNLILPSITLGIRPLSIFIQLSRNSILDILSQDYIRTARAKGLSFSRVIRKHALKNSLNPLVTAISGWFASLMAGVVFVEYIFGWKGLGYLIVNALNQYDMPVVLGSVLTIAFVFVMINMLVDTTYAILDPRVRTAG